MKKFIFHRVLGCILIFMLVPIGLIAQHAELNVDELLSMSSMVSGETFWSSDGEEIYFKRGSGLVVVDTDERYFQELKPLELGSAGHFLADQNIRISPDGNQIAYISNKDGNPEIWVYSIQVGKDRKVTDLGQNGINALSWSPDGQFIAFSGNRYGKYDIWKVRVQDEQTFQMTSGELYEVNPSWSPDGEYLLYVELNNEWTDQTVYKINSSDASEKEMMVEEEDFFDYGYGRTFGFPIISPDSQYLLFRSHRSGWINYWVKNLSTNELSPVFAEEADQNDAVWSPDGSQVAFTSNVNGTHSLNVITVSSGQRIELVNPEMGVVSDPQWSADGSEISYLLETPLKVKDLHVVTVNDQKSRQLTFSMPFANYQDYLAEPEKITYKSTDGFTIPAYVYTPDLEKYSGTVPAIMWIHGGPTSQFHDSFQQHVQYFVQNGYAVLMPNIRGSSGYGKDFEKANNECWGHCDMDDVEAGVEYLKSLDYIDSSNIAVHGTSYGGIMSMAAAAFRPDLFQASIPAAGYGDWVSFYHNPNELRHYKLSNYELGTFEENEEVWRKASSIYSVEDIKTPMFIIHGEGKYPPSPQSEQFAKELEAHYKTFQYKAYPNENYYVYGKENRRQMLLDMKEFLDKFLKDDVIDHTN